MGERQPPPSRVSSEGGGREVVEENSLPRLAFRAREGVRVVVEDERLPPSRVSSEGGSGGETTPSISRFERGREYGVVVEDKRLPPSRISSKGGSRGGGGRQMSPSVSRLERGRDRQPPPSRISSERGGGANKK